VVTWGSSAHTKATVTCASKKVVVAPAVVSRVPTEGTHVVGAAGIKPGTYQTANVGNECYWARLSGFGGTTGEIIENGIAPGPMIVTIASTDAGFTATRCGTWTPLP
jgi:hypothetical protein